MNEDLEMRRRRAIYRAGHRGTKELDILLSRFASARVTGMNEHELAEFEALLEIQDPQLQDWLVRREAPVGDDVPPLVSVVRTFHGLA